MRLSHFLFACVMALAIMFVSPTAAAVFAAVSLPTLASWHLWNLARAGTPVQTAIVNLLRFPCPQTGVLPGTAFA